MKKFFLYLAFCLAPTAVFAAESIDGIEEIVIEEKVPVAKVFSKLRIENTYSKNYQATDRKEEYNYSVAQVNLNMDAVIKKNWRIESWFRYAEVSQQREEDRRTADADGGGDRSYENNGLGIRELKFAYEDDKIRAYVGKFRPHFGIAWGVGRGIWGNQIAANYQQTEKIGVAAYRNFGNINTIGKYNLGVSFFTNDRKNLDNTLFNKRDSDRKSDARPGDTRNLDSYVGTLDIFYDFGKNEKLSYRFSYINLAVNGRASQVVANKIADQKGYSAMMNYQYPVNDGLLLNGLAEYVEMKNVEGNSDISDNYFSSSLMATILKNWNATLIYNERKNLYAGQNGFDQNMAEISFGYTFDKNSLFDSFLIQTSYRNLRTDYKSSLDVKNSYAILARYIKNF